MKEKQWAADAVERRSVKDLVPYDRNPRVHPQEQIDQLANSIEEWGWTFPILIDENNNVLSGHGRLLAAKKLGIDEVPCLVSVGWSQSQKTAYIIADNKIAEQSRWDDDLLKSLMSDVGDGLTFDDSFDLDLLGFDKDELNEFLLEDRQGLTDADQVPEAPETPITRGGDVWVLGNHRLMCGDSTKMDEVERLMDGQKADMVFTDPPYNADYKSLGSNELLRQGIKNDSMSDDRFESFISDFLRVKFEHTKQGASYYICCNWKDSYPRFYNNLTETGVNVSSCIVWNKGSGGMGWQDYRYQYEFIIYAFKQDAAHSWYGDRTQTDIWSVNREARQNYIHPTQKPVEIIEKALKNSSKSKHLVLDLFGGSGSTLIACEKTNRNAYLMELDPKYCDVIIKRWQEFTGENAILESTGKMYGDDV